MIRNFVNTWLQQRGYIKADKLPQWIVETAEAERWTMPDPQVYGNQADLYRKLSYIGTVVDVVADSCVDADFDITDANEQEDDNHPFIKLLDKPNPYDSRTEFLRAHFAWRKVSGNSYWYLNRTSATVAPDEIWLIPPSKIIPVPDGTMGLKGYMYTPGNGAKIPLEPYEVMHFKSFNPFSRYIGLSAIESLASTAYGALAAQDWNTRLFAENNARLPGILAFSEMIQDTDWKLMKDEVTNSAAKRNNMMLRGVGKGGVEWMQAAATQREMEFLAGLDRSMREIYDRLAPGLYNMLTANSSLANGETGMIAFARYTLQPLLREFTDKLNAELLPVYSEGWKAEYEDVVPEDKAMKMAEIEQFAKFHTIDEVRVEKFGNDPDSDKERGALLFVQVTAKQAEPVQPEAMTQEKPAVEQAEPVQEPEDKEDAEMKADLSRWKRKATKNLGNVAKMTGFESDYIPADMARTIRESLPACKTADDVAGVFEAVKGGVISHFGQLAEIAPSMNKGAEEIKALAASIDALVSKATTYTETITEL